MAHLQLDDLLELFHVATTSTTAVASATTRRSVERNDAPLDSLMHVLNGGSKAAVVHGKCVFVTTSGTTGTALPALLRGGVALG